MSSRRPLPRWLQRRWVLLQNALQEEAFRDTVLPQLSSQYKANGNLPTPDCLAALRAYNIPSEAAPALWHLLENPDLVKTPRELITQIKSPVSYTSHRSLRRGPSADERGEYDTYKSFRDNHDAPLGPYEMADPSLLLEVSPYTSKQELMDFIDEHYDTHLSPLLKVGASPFTPPIIARGGRVRERSRITQQILDLHTKGFTPKQIVATLRGDLTESNVSKTIARHKRRA